MTRDEFRKRMATDGVFRLKFIIKTAKFYEELGLELSDEDVRKLTDEALKNVAATPIGGGASGGPGGGAERTAVIITVF